MNDKTTATDSVRAKDFMEAYLYSPKWLKLRRSFVPTLTFSDYIVPYEGGWIFRVAVLHDAADRN